MNAVNVLLNKNTFFLYKIIFWERLNMPTLTPGVLVYPERWCPGHLRASVEAIGPLCGGGCGCGCGCGGLLGADE